MKQSKPGDLFNKFQEKKKKAVAKSGSFGGKSNKLGQGGRAAQLKAQGVPGGVIGNLARAAHAAPGEKNFHKKGKKGKKKMKFGKKKKTLRSASEVVKSEQNASHQFKGKKHFKHKKTHKKEHSEEAIKGMKDFVEEESKEKNKKKKTKGKTMCKKHKKMHCKMCMKSDEKEED